MEWTGERLVTTKQGEIVELHLHRYAVASEYTEGKRVLDIASGEGYGSHLLSASASRVIGVDIDPEAVGFAQNKYGSDKLEFLCGSADKIPLADHSVDVVVSFETIEHHDKHEEMMSEIRRVLVPGGVVVISSPDKLNYSDVPEYSNPYHVKELYREEFKDLMQAYFSHVSLYYQRMYYGSMMIHESGEGAVFKEYGGNFRQLRSSAGMKDPMYIICIASDQPLAATNVNSAFDSNELFSRIADKEREIYASKTYRLGNFLLFPYRIIQRLKK